MEGLGIGGVPGWWAGRLECHELELEHSSSNSIWMEERDPRVCHVCRVLMRACARESPKDEGVRHRLSRLLWLEIAISSPIRAGLNKVKFPPHSVSTLATIIWAKRCVKTAFCMDLTIELPFCMDLTILGVRFHSPCSEGGSCTSDISDRGGQMNE